MRTRTWWLVPWLTATAVGQAGALAATWYVFVGTARGQRLDTAALSANHIGRAHLDDLVDTVLEAMSVLSLVVATVAIGFIALARGRVALGVLATVLIAGANLTTQVLKQALARPDFGIDLARIAAGNSLPSGHTTVAASVAVALVLVLPRRLRAVAAVAGTAYAAVAGVATVSAGWHRPSDPVASYLVVGAWAALVGLGLVMLRQRHRQHGVGGRRGSAQAHQRLLGTLAGGGAVLLVLAAAAMLVTDRALATGGPPGPADALGRAEELFAYTGAAAGIAGVCTLVTAVVLATVHHLVPARPAASSTGTPAAAGARV